MSQWPRNSQRERNRSLVAWLERPLLSWQSTTKKQQRSTRSALHITGSRKDQGRPKVSSLRSRDYLCVQILQVSAQQEVQQQAVQAKIPEPRGLFASANSKSAASAGIFLQALQALSGPPIDKRDCAARRLQMHSRHSKLGGDSRNPPR